VGRGVVDLTDADGIAFRPFALDTAGIDLGSAQRLIPALTLRGRLDGAGTLEGPYTNARWSGTLRHQDGDAPVTLVRGTLRLDARRDTLGVSVDVIADTLALAGLQPSFPGLALGVSLRGPIRMEGTLAAATTHAELETLTGAGQLRVDGNLTLLGTPLGAGRLSLIATDLDLRAWLGGNAPPTRLAFTATGDVRADSGMPPVGALQLRLAPSLIAGSAIDSGAAHLRFADGLVHVDSLRVEQAGVLATGSGAIGWSAPQSGQLEIEIDADSLGTFDSLVTWLAPVSANALDTIVPLQGAGTVQASLEGALDSLLIVARAEVAKLRWREWAVPAGSTRLQWQAGSELIDVSADVDSVTVGGLGFGGVVARVAGRADSLSWFVRTRMGDWLAALGGGSFTRSPAVTSVRIDSAAVLLPGEVWLLAAPGEVRVTAASVTLADSGFLWRQGGDTGSMRFSGALPLDSAGDARLAVRGVPLAALAALLVNDTTGVRGRVDADVALRGTQRDPVLRASVTAAGDPGIGTPFLARGAATYVGRRLDARLEVARGERRVLDLTAHLPLDLALTNVARRQVADTLWVRAVADSVDLSQLGLLDAFSTGVSGRVSADLVVRGTWDTPTLAGRAEVNQAAATLRSLNVRYEDVNGAFSFAGDTIRVDSLRLRSGPGRLAVDGYVRLDRLTRPLLGLDLDARDFKALEIRNYLSVTASGQVALRGPVFGATLTGRGTVNSGVLYFADLVTKRVVNLDEPWVATLITPEELRRQDIDRGFHNRFLDSLRIRDLTLSMGTDVWLRSTEANIQLTGAVAVFKEAQNYVLSGTLQAPRGTYRLLVGPVTREFVVSDGTVRYFGTADLNAELNITARHVVRNLQPTSGQPQDIPITAHIGGTLLVPRLRLSVEGQQLSQTEIVSYLLFGRQAFELGQTSGGNREVDLVRSTTLSVLSAGLSGELERTLVSDLGVPLDYLEVRPGDPNRPLTGALLAAGWQIGERTFLTLNAGFCGSQVDFSKVLGATLQFRISPEWRTEASFEPVRTCTAAGVTPTRVDLQFGLDLFWERRY
jgi:translocation and assembly module TamB